MAVAISLVCDDDVSFVSENITNVNTEERDTIL